MPDASDAADGEKLGPPGVIPLTTNCNNTKKNQLRRLHKSYWYLLGPDGEKYRGVPCSQGVIGGLMLGVEPAPKNIPVAPISDDPSVLEISIPCLHFSASKSRSKQPTHSKIEHPILERIKKKNNNTHRFPFSVADP